MESGSGLVASGSGLASPRRQQQQPQQQPQQSSPVMAHLKLNPLSDDEDQSERRNSALRDIRMPPPPPEERATKPSADYGMPLLPTDAGPKEWLEAERQRPGRTAAAATALLLATGLVARACCRREKDFHGGCGGVRQCCAQQPGSAANL